MNLDQKRAAKCLTEFDFKKLFIREMGWDHSNDCFDLPVDGQPFTLSAVAQKRGMMAYTCTPAHDGEVPPPAFRRKIDTQVEKRAHEHLVIYTDVAKTTQIWQWIRREPGKTAASREQTYTVGQSGELLIQKLQALAFGLDEEERLSLLDVTTRVKASFDVERVTKRFYDEFKGEHANLVKFLQGIPVGEDANWYASVILDRLMFIYFIQKKNFLNGDPNYLRIQLMASKSRGKDRFYREFLLVLFFEGLAHEDGDRAAATRSLLGKVPYLNGGLFLPHQMERKYGAALRIPDEVFDRIFAFFDKYTWHLDDRPLRADNEINPDVLGYIFEKYINQKQMGAYYTKEDITGYNCRYTILPFLLDKLANYRWDAVHPLPIRDVEPYIYEAVKTTAYLPTETEREYLVRQQWAAQIRSDFAAGKITTVDDLITYNLDIERFVQDWLRNMSDPVTLRAFYFECLKKLTVLDPTVGSGAFLFAAMNILERLYELCLERMAALAGPKYADFRDELARVASHPNRRYFIYKTIIVHNLYGVDIMEEATEICKLRLFLKLVAQVEDVGKIEPLPDIDFNIRAGNTLIGFATQQEIETPRTLYSIDPLEKTRELARDLYHYRDMQTQRNFSPRDLAKAKEDAKAQLDEIEKALHRTLYEEYGGRDLQAFICSTQPFHWYVEFYDIMQDGGFDVIVGNPPYLEVSEIEYRPNGFRCAESRAVHAMCIERAAHLLNTTGRMSMIVPMSLVSTQRMRTVQDLLEVNHSVWYANFAWRPGKLFDTVNRALTVFVIGPSAKPATFSTGYQKWYSEARPTLMALIRYIAVPRQRTYSWVPKLSQPIERDILDKCLAHGTKLAQCMGKTAHRVYYRTTGGLYWKVFTDIPPAFNVNGVAGHSTRETHFCVQQPEMVYSVVALLSSDLFWWWYTISSNLRDLNPFDLENFPVSKVCLSNGRLVALGKQYLADIKAKSSMLVRQQKQTGRTETQSFKIQLSKDIINQIDVVVAEDYGLTSGELGFLINYDLKYRLGKDDDNGSED